MPPGTSRLVITLALTERCNYSPPVSEVQPARRIFVLFCVCSVLKSFPEPLGWPESLKPLQMFTGNRSAAGPASKTHGPWNAEWGHLQQTASSLGCKNQFPGSTWDLVSNDFKDVYVSLTCPSSTCRLVLNHPAATVLSRVCDFAACFAFHFFFFLTWGLAWTRMVLNSLYSQIGLKLVIPLLQPP